MASLPAIPAFGSEDQKRSGRFLRRVGKPHLDELISSAQTWLPIVRQLRPRHSWDDVVRILDRQGHDWTVERLRRAVHRMVGEKLAEPELLGRSPRRPQEDYLMRLVAGIAIADPELSIREIAAQLDQMRERPPRGSEMAAVLRQGIAG